MKKRILAIVLGTAMTLSMVGCGGTNEETPATTPDTKHRQLLLRKQQHRLRQQVAIITSK